MQKILIWLMTLLVAVTAPATGKSENTEEIDPAKQVEIIKAVSSGLVTVEYTLCYDKGQPPAGADVTYICPNCGRPHTRRVGEQLIKDERPLEEAGFLISPTMVVTRDIILHPRFIKAIRVRSGDQTVDTRITSYAVDNNAVFLELDSVLDGAKLISFDTSGDEPYMAITYTQVNGIWTTSLKPLPTDVSISKRPKKFIIVPPSCLIVDKGGKPIGIAMNGELPLDDSWKGSPRRWTTLSAKKLATKLKNLKKVVDKSLLRVLLNFRSPKAKAGSQYSSFSRSYSSRTMLDTQATEEHGIGASIDKKHVLVLINLVAETTARLEQVHVFDNDGQAHEAEFVGSISDLGALVVSTDKPLGAKIAFADTDILDMKNKLLLTAKVSAKGGQRVAYFSHGRVIGYSIGHGHKIYPKFNGKNEDVFFFNLNNELVVMPMNLRQKISLRNDSGRWRRVNALLTSASEIASVVADMTERFDPNNVPLNEEKEERTAWMGTVLQGLNRDLARANHCSEQTEDGKTGALVTFVYPDSPGARAGITPGMVLLRLVVEGEPKPINVKIEDRSSGHSFQWDQLDRMPPDYFDRIPPPWSSVKNSFNRLLTDIGFGTEYTAEFIHEGQEFFKKFAVVESPAHFDSASKHKSESLGITVRNLTFEVRHYLQKEKDDPGVIISKIETGSKAAVAGIKPYEHITHVNGKSVMNVEEFAQITSENDELVLSVNRMTQTRQVRIKLDRGN